RAGAGSGLGRPWRKRGQKDRAHGQLCRGACGTRSSRGASFGHANGCRNTNPVAGSPAEHSTNPRGASLPPLSSSPPQPMKRSSTPTPDLPAAARRRRSLSEEERALWESVAKDTKPLRKKPRVTKAPANSHAADGQAAVKLVEPSLMKPIPSDKISQRPAPPPLAPLARRERAQLSRGKK